MDITITRKQAILLFSLIMVLTLANLVLGIELGYTYMEMEQMACVPRPWQ